MTDKSIEVEILCNFQGGDDEVYALVFDGPDKKPHVRRMYRLDEDENEVDVVPSKEPSYYAQSFRETAIYQSPWRWRMGLSDLTLGTCQDCNNLTHKI